MTTSLEAVDGTYDDEIMSVDFQLDPFPLYNRIREEAPVYWCQPWNAWLVTRYDDVRHVLRSPADFSSSLGATQIRDPDPADLPFIRRMILNMDPPEQVRLRKLVTGAFTRRRLERSAQTIRARAADLLDAVAGRGRCDLPREVTDDAGGQGLTGVWDTREQEIMADRVERQVERFAPGFRAVVRARRVLAPPTLQSLDRNLDAGAVNGGTTALHQQAVFRPMPGTGRPATPVAGLVQEVVASWPIKPVLLTPRADPLAQSMKRAAFRAAGSTAPQT